MKILYLSCHSILEYQEVKLLTELGHDVFSVGGAYQNPEFPQDMKRPGFKGFYSDQLQSVALQCSKENLHPELIEWADVIIVMHRNDWILLNWEKMKHKVVIWRTIGQSVPDVEVSLSIPRMQGLKIIRYSPEEDNLGNFLGSDAMIRFYTDENELYGYTGEINKVITVAQSMMTRGKFCGYDIFNEATNNFARTVFGPNNENTGFSGGLLSYDELLVAYRKHRVYFYTGTYPASYTLNFIEAFTTGIPIVAIGRGLANLNIFPNTNVYEVDKFIQNGENGFISDNIHELRGYVEMLLNDHQKALEIGLRGRETAISFFSKEKIKEQWRMFLSNI